MMYYKNSIFAQAYVSLDSFYIIFDSCLKGLLRVWWAPNWATLMSNYHCLAPKGFPLKLIKQVLAFCSVIGWCACIQFVLFSIILVVHPINDEIKQCIVVLVSMSFYAISLNILVKLFCKSFRLIWTSLVLSLLRRKIEIRAQFLWLF